MVTSDFSFGFHLYLWNFLFLLGGSGHAARAASTSIWFKLAEMMLAGMSSTWFLSAVRLVVMISE